METYTLAQFPSDVRTVHIALFHDLANATEIRQSLIAASTMGGEQGDTARKDIDFGFIEASLIVSREHILTAIQTTLINSITPTGISTRSHNLHSELLLTLSPNNNITDSIRRHGLSDKTTELLVVRIEPESEEGQASKRQEILWSEIERVVKGKLVSMDEIENGTKTDWSRVDKIYKLSEMNALKLPKQDLLERKKAAVVSTVAIKSVS